MIYIIIAALLFVADSIIKFKIEASASIFFFALKTLPRTKGRCFIMNKYEFYLEQFENGSMEVPTLDQLNKAADNLESEMRKLNAAEKPESIETIDKMLDLLEKSSELDSIVKAVTLYGMRHPEQLERIAMS